MSALKTVLEPWIVALVEATDDLATTSLGWEGAKVIDNAGSLPVGMSGSHIALIGDIESAQVGIVASEEGCGVLARTILGMEPGDDLDEADMADAIAEVINIVAGGVKSRMIAIDPSIKLGLPVYIQGRVMATPQQERIVSVIELGPIEARLVVLHPKK